MHPFSLTRDEKQRVIGGGLLVSQSNSWAEAGYPGAIYTPIDDNPRKQVTAPSAYAESGNGYIAIP